MYESSENIQLGFNNMLYFHYCINYYHLQRNFYANTQYVTSCNLQGGFNVLRRFCATLQLVLILSIKSQNNVYSQKKKIASSVCEEF